MPSRASCKHEQAIKSCFILYTSVWLVLEKCSSTLIEGEKTTMTVEGQTHFRLETAALQGEQDGIFEFAS